jgi:hypothetical protein
MPRWGQDLACVLSGADDVEAGLARSLLEAAGIPCLLHGPDFDVAELGIAAHRQVRGTDLFVPPALAERAQGVLEEAWGPRDASGRPVRHERRDRT